jgi:hypothetical protein
VASTRVHDIEALPAHAYYKVTRRTYRRRYTLVCNLRGAIHGETKVPRLFPRIAIQSVAGVVSSTSGRP